MESGTGSPLCGDRAQLCVICDQAAVGLGPFSRMHLCRQHLSVDEVDARKLKEEVAEELRAFSEGGVGAAPVGEELLSLSRELQEIEQKFDALQRELDEFRARLTGLFRARLEAARVWQRDLEDADSYKQEVAVEEAAGNMAEVVHLAESMQASLPDLQADFERTQKLFMESDGAELQLRRLRQLQRLVGSAASGADLLDAATDTANDFEAGVIARHNRCRIRYTSSLLQGTCGCAEDVCTHGSILRSHEVKLDGWVHWLAVCSDTSGFVSDSCGRVAPTGSAGDSCAALPQPCIFAVLSDKDYLMAISLDGTQILKCQCFITWKKLVWGLHCDRQLLFIAQPDVVTVADLSGRIKYCIQPDICRFGDIWGIGGNAASVFVSSGNKIAAFSMSNFELQTVITLSEFPDADLYNIACHDDCILVADKHHNRVHRVRIDTQRLLASYPTDNCGLAQFAYPYDVAVDRRGRLFVSEFRRHSVRAVAANDGSLLWTLGESGEHGSGDDRLCCPCGLVVVPGGPCEQLVVADRNNKRLVVLNLE